MHKWTITPTKPIKIAFLLFDQFSNHCLANCLEPLRACSSFANHPVFEWEFLTLTGHPVQSSSGLPILPDGALADMKRCDYLFVNASYDYMEHDTAQCRIGLQKVAKQTDVMVGLDTGAWLMAAAGLLNDKSATVHWDTFDQFSEKFPRVNAEYKRLTQDGNRYTCAGVMSAFDLALLLITKHLGQSAKVDIEAFFLHQDAPLTAHQPQQTSRDPLLNKALNVMYNTVEKPLSRQSLARSLSCQAKTLDRRCISEFGVTANHLYRHIRLSVAQQMIVSTSLSIFEISLRCGFQDASTMTRAYKERFGMPPSQSRSQLTTK